MNKLGFYTQNSQGVHQWINEVQPPVMLIHAWDQGLLTEIRQIALTQYLYDRAHGLHSL